MTYAINWDATHEAVIKELGSRLYPLHYRTVYDLCAKYAARGTYSNDTDPGEKLRQYYAEHERPDVAAFPGGYIGLRRWFSDPRQGQTIQPPERVIIRGKCSVSYDAGFEQAKRQAYMVDHFGDANTGARHDRRRRAALVESHVKDFFRIKYPQYYRPPSNEGKYDKAASDDFSLDLGDRIIFVDAKSWSGERGFMPNPQASYIYLWADWIDGEDDETVVLNGFISGAWVRMLGEQGDRLWSVERNHVFSVDQFLVHLNMLSQTNLDIALFRKHLRQRNKKAAPPAWAAFA